MSTQDILHQLQLCLPRLAGSLREDLRLQELGLDSMETVELLCVVHEEFGVRLTEAEFQPQHRLGQILAAIALKATSSPRVTV